MDWGQISLGAVIQPAMVLIQNVNQLRENIKYAFLLIRAA